MTLIIATTVSGNEIFLHGDTISTFREAALHSDTPIIQYTSFGEELKPDINGNQITFFNEDSCKIGIFNNDILCGASGHSSLIFDALKIPAAKLSSNMNLEQLSALFEEVRISIEASGTFKGQQASLTFAIRQSDRFSVLGISFDVSAENSVVINKRAIDLTPGHGWQISDGSAARDMAGYFPGSISQLYKDDPSIRDALSSLLSLSHSTFLAHSRGYYADGAGGAIIGFVLDENGIHPMKDTIFINSRDNLIRSICKIAYRGDLFFITDYLQGKLTAMRTLNSELKFRQQPYGPIDITEVVKDCVRFNAPLILLDEQSEKYPGIPNVAIVESGNGAEVLRNISPTAEDSRFLHFFPGSSLTLSLRNGVRTLIVPEIR